MLKNKKWVSASKAGRSAFCPKYLEHENNNRPVGMHAVKARLKGDVAHYQKNKQVARDQRCYIASYAFGLNDTRTEELRIFRDEVLTRSITGRAFVILYYLFSPSLIRLAKYIPGLNMLLISIAETVLRITRNKNDRV